MTYPISSLNMKKLIFSIAFAFAAAASQAGWHIPPLSDYGSYSGPDGNAHWANGTGSYAGNDGSYLIWDRHGWTYTGPDGRYSNRY
jgi:hypothetical protein